MTDPHDTLNIGSLRLRKDYPVAQTEIDYASPGHAAAKNPKAAHAARARIAALPDSLPTRQLHPDALSVHLATATPTAKLITNKQRLAEEAKTKPLTHGRRLPSVLVPFLTAAGVFLIVLLLFKAPVIINQMNYAFSNGSNSNRVAALAPAGDLVPAENTISIPKINLHAPVNYEPSIQEAAIQKSLETGVVHYGNTAAPGEKGNVAIFGHSSNDWWEPGNYKFVFVLLDKLAPGDQVTLDYQSHRYTYEVTGSRVVEPTDIGVLASTPTPTLTLITCTPPGTSLRRLVVTAKQVSPDPSKAVVATAASPQSAPSALPSSSAPSFFDQLGQAWNSVFTGIPALFGGSSPSPSPSPAATGSLPTAK